MKVSADRHQPREHLHPQRYRIVIRDAPVEPEPEGQVIGQHDQSPMEAHNERTAVLQLEVPGLPVLG